MIDSIFVVLVSAVRGYGTVTAEATKLCGCESEEAAKEFAIGAFRVKYPDAHDVQSDAMEITLEDFEQPTNVLAEMPG